MQVMNNHVIAEFTVVSLSTEDYSVTGNSIVTDSEMIDFTKITIHANERIHVYKGVEPQLVTGDYFLLEEDEGVLRVVVGHYDNELHGHAELIDEYQILPPEANKYYVTFNIGNYQGDQIDPYKVNKGQTIEEPELIVYVNEFIDGWYTDPELTNKFDFSTPINGNLTLYANIANVTTYSNMSLGGIVISLFDNLDMDAFYVNNSLSDKKYTFEYNNGTSLIVKD